MNKNALNLLKEIESRKEQLLTHSALIKLNRVETIGHNNVVYYEAYNELKKKYDEIIVQFSSNYDLYHKEAETSDNKAQLRKALRKLVDLEDACETQLNVFDEVISERIKDDIDLKTKEAQLKDTLKECQQIIDDNISSLKFLRKEFNEYFRDVDQSISYFNDYLLRGSTVDAKELYEDLNRRVNLLRNNLNVLPEYAKEVAFELPALINGVIKQFNEMQKEDYKLFDIPANNVIAECKTVYSTLLADIRKFQLDNFAERINDIKAKIQSIKDSLDNEKQSKEDYEKEYKKAHNEAEDLVRDYNKLIKNMDDFNKRFITNTENDNTSLSNAVQSLRNTTYSLPSYEQYSYSTRAEKLNELVKNIKVVKDMMNDIKGSYELKESTSVDALTVSSQSLSDIRNLEVDLENTHLEKLQEKYFDSLVQLKYLARGIKQLLEEEQINIDEVNKRTNKLTEEFDLIKKNATEEITCAKKVCEMIKFANNFVGQDNELSRDIAKAEIYYQDGRYTEAFDYAKRALAKYETPDFAERIK